MKAVLLLLLVVATQPTQKETSKAAELMSFYSAAYYALNPGCTAIKAGRAGNRDRRARQELAGRLSVAEDKIARKLGKWQIEKFQDEYEEELQHIHFSSCPAFNKKKASRPLRALERYLNENHLE